MNTKISGLNYCIKASLLWWTYRLLLWSCSILQSHLILRWWNYSILSNYSRKLKLILGLHVVQTRWTQPLLTLRHSVFPKSLDLTITKASSKSAPEGLPFIQVCLQPKCWFCFKTKISEKGGMLRRRRRKTTLVKCIVFQGKTVSFILDQMAQHVWKP